MARGFQDAMVEVLARRSRCRGQPGLLLGDAGGGVACNQVLVERVRSMLSGDATVAVASNRLNTDNAAMIVRGRLAPESGESSGWDSSPEPICHSRSHHSASLTGHPDERLSLVWRFGALLGHIEIRQRDHDDGRLLMGGWLIALELRRRGLHEVRGGHHRRGGDRRHHRRQAVVLGDERRKPLLARWPGMVRRVCGGAAAVMSQRVAQAEFRSGDLPDRRPVSRRGLCAGRIGCFIVNDDYGRPTIFRGESSSRRTAALNGGEHDLALRHPDAAGTDPQTVLAVHPTRCTRSPSCWPSSPSCGGGGSRPNRWAGCSGLSAVCGSRAFPDRIPAGQGRSPAGPAQRWRRW